MKFVVIVRIETARYAHPKRKYIADEVQAALDAYFKDRLPVIKAGVMRDVEQETGEE